MSRRHDYDDEEEEYDYDQEDGPKPIIRKTKAELAELLENARRDRAFFRMKARSFGDATKEMRTIKKDMETMVREQNERISTLENRVNGNVNMLLDTHNERFEEIFNRLSKVEKRSKGRK